MTTYKFTLKPQSYFATPLQGDTFLGQLCWGIVAHFGEERLTQLLAQYAQSPFAVVSDAFPSGYLPKPQLPQHKLGIDNLDPIKRKEIKRKQWIPVADAAKPISQWMTSATTDKELLQAAKNEQASALVESHQRMHNSINRLTGTTGEAGFAPYGVQTHWYAEGMLWDIYVVLDEQQLSLDELTLLITELGRSGYGKDASIGAGQFSLEQAGEANLPHSSQANAVLTLACCAPQGQEVKAQECYYLPFTRFGRHGDWAVMVNPYKAPIIMAKTAAVFSPMQMAEQEYFGQALGGAGEISKTLPETIHQGYTPVLRIALDV